MPAIATAYLRKLRLFSRDVRLYLITSAMLGFCGIGTHRLLFSLYLLRLGYGPEFIGLVAAVGTLANAAVSLPAGAFGRRWGNRSGMIVGMTLMVAGLGLPALVELIPTSLWVGWLLVTGSLIWAGMSVYSVNASPYLMAVSGPQERDYVFSMQLALWPLTGFAGNLVGGFVPGLLATTLGVSLNDPAPYRYPLLMAATLLLPAVAVLSATREAGPPDAEGRATEKKSVPRALVALVALVMLLQLAGETSVRTFFTVYLDDGLHALPSRIGGINAFGRLLSVPAALAAPLLMGRWVKSRVFILASAGVAISLLSLALVPHWAAAALGFAGMMALAAIARATVTVYGMEIVSPASRSAMSSASMLGSGFGRFAMSLGGGYVVTGLGYRSLFLLGAGVTALAALLFGAYFRVPRGELAGRPAQDEAGLAM